MSNFEYPGEAIFWAIRKLTHSGQGVDTGHWQGVETQGRPDLETLEITNLQLSFPISSSPRALAFEVAPNLPWAEDHFQERVSRVPSNPGEEYKNWPWWRGQVDDTQEQGKFTHTYQERFWPKLAGDLDRIKGQEIYGVRYAYGDLDDVIALLRKYPYTRQATFPIFFPEDTGAVHGGRIPCTLHYHFLMRNNQLDLYYPIRSCDAVRHFRDDLYMAGRLCQWVLEELRKDFEIPPTAMGDDMMSADELWFNVRPGRLHFTAYSFHVHRGDYHLL